MVFLAAVFLFCGGTVAVVQHQYQINKRLYREASASFTELNTPGANVTPSPETPKPEETKKPSKLDDGIKRLDEVAPIKVNFEELKEVNDDVRGWIYCPDTVIDYPILHGKDNDQYLHRSYNGVDNASGSIFVDAENQKDFADPISIVYGHHMSSGAMFASLDKWQTRDFFAEHPVMWILTPEQDYKLVLFSAYHTSAYSDTYNLYGAPSIEFAEHLRDIQASSAVPVKIDLDQNAHYVILSTCAYIFIDARAVVVGRLYPIMSAGGVRIE